MPPCEALTTTAPRASASAIRVMLSATTIGAAEEGIAGDSQREGCEHHAGSVERWTSATAVLPLTPASPRKRGEGFAAALPGLPSPRSRGEGWGEGPDWLALPLGVAVEGGGGVFDAVVDCLCAQVLEARQFAINSVTIVI